ncbi:ferredoxin-type protein NapF [Accumulibacter sp.]|uniref:ferredoxin-type protein NapF n=1 Tax=Accumulibacter sp. TaxID=2053492 RepID=UPI0028C4717B|nr:ferredoxin-type protein NapF [Accumulibacter sp.]
MRPCKKRCFCQSITTRKSTGPVTDLSSRRNFLRGRFSKRTASLRPPWVAAESAFLLACTRCGDCRTACPTRIISDRDGGYPVLDFALGECTFCGACVDACTTGALRRADGQAPWLLRAVIGEHCLARQQVECRICGDQCVAGAIHFVPRVGGISTPLVDISRCTGCGACFAPCPTRAITVGKVDDLP